MTEATNDCHKLFHSMADGGDFDVHDPDFLDVMHVLEQARSVFVVHLI